jgi:hypothetical protein
MEQSKRNLERQARFPFQPRKAVLHSCGFVGSARFCRGKAGAQCFTVGMHRRIGWGWLLRPRPCRQSAEMSEVYARHGFHWGGLFAGVAAQVLR